MNKAFGLSHQPAEKAYLEALAEAYKTADSWDTRRQVLSTMSDTANFNVISEYIPGLTHYRFTMANLRRLQYGRSRQRSFNDLGTVVLTISPLKKDGENWAAEMQEALKVGKLYLKGDYKVHVSDNACVPDHCYMYVLSDITDKDFKYKCKHKHDERCEQCESLDLTLKNIEQAIEEERDETLYLFTSAVRAINLWKGHQLRSVQQDQARLDVINLLKDEKTVYIVNDWAMKFLPHQYRESQSDWFGKNGISWHISVVFRKSNGQLESQSFIHIIESCSQDSAAIVLIMQHVLKTLETENPKLKRAFFRQDNAGCYHSASTILACHHIAKTTLTVLPLLASVISDCL
ncbi:Hypothetical predicted protein [Paramuricea clavata]|uniref:Uncharacterized protein n=1 Tax=Paramuricea clavata TaxID=317549 RepID=A0A6S7FR86_PARCT|nr:Hypothetical predicted protein [Paramuricea clavata]